MIVAKTSIYLFNFFPSFMFLFVIFIMQHEGQTPDIITVSPEVT